MKDSVKRWKIKPQAGRNYLPTKYLTNNSHTQQWKKSNYKWQIKTQLKTVKMGNNCLMSKHFHLE